MEALTNRDVKEIKQLKLKKYRLHKQCFIIEGEKLIQEAYEKRPDLIRELIITSEIEGAEWLNNLTPKLASNKQMSQISSLKTASTAIAVIDFPSDQNSSNLVIALDGVQNPGNLGTIIRTAAWFGCYQIMASEDTVDVYNPKVVQATMGSIFDVSITYCNLETYLKKVDFPVYGANMEGENIYSAAPVKNAVIVMGSEGKGLSEQVEKCISQKIAIPKLGKGESLNVAMATGIILSEFNRKLQK
jgi:TrmH family RNA methyltransferase